MRRYAFKEVLEPGVLASELAERVYPQLESWLFNNLTNKDPDPLIQTQAIPELAAIFKNLLANLRDGAKALAMLGNEHISGDQIRSMMYRKDSPINNPVWRELNNDVCTFVLNHTVNGEHVYVPERARYVLEKVFDLLREKIKDKPAVKSGKDSERNFN